MIEPHSAQLGASSWILKATLVVPSDSVIADPPPLPFAAFGACPLPFLATTASSSAAALPAAPDVDADGSVASAFGASVATEAFGGTPGTGGEGSSPALPARRSAP